MKAIISDIHGNLEALEAVLADIHGQGIDEIYCLGDVVGYGPDPCECVDLVMKHCKLSLLGNHDQGALFDPEGFNAGAERAIFWTRSILESGDPSGKERRWDYLGEAPRSYRQGDYLLVHGSARNPLNEYVFPEDIYNQLKMERIFGLIDRYCFQGHTHVPGVFTENLNFFSPSEIEGHFELGQSKIMANVGSVGQPRDGDPRSCYVTLENASLGESDEDSSGSAQSQFSKVDHDTNEGEGKGAPVPSPSNGPVLLKYRRVEYDFEKTAAKIYNISDLDDFLGDRLRDGR